MSIVMKAFVIMMNKRALLLAVFLMIIRGEATLASCDFSDFPSMPEMRVSGLMGDAAYNNKPMMIRSFSAEASTDELVGYYKRVWKDAFSESVFGDWKQISTLDGECFLTVQYGGIGGDSSFGRLVISNLPDASNQVLGEGVLKSSDSIVVSDLATKDGPKLGRVTVLTSSSTVSELVSFYRTEMSAKGWRLQSDFNQAAGSALVFRKGLDESNIVIAPAGDSTQILINTVEVD